MTNTHVLFSFMWSLAHAFQAQTPHPSVAKIEAYCLFRCRLLPADRLDEVEERKIQAWNALSESFEGEVNIPIILDWIYWTYPQILGRGLKEHMEKMIDECLPDSVEVGLPKAVAERFMELLG